MVEKYRVHEVGKDLGIPSKDVIELLGQYFGGDQKKHMTALEPDELSLILEHYTRKHSVESFDAYFATAAEKKSAPPPPPPAEEPAAAPAPVLEATPAPIAEAAPPPRRDNQTKARQGQQGQQARPQGQPGQHARPQSQPGQQARPQGQQSQQPRPQGQPGQHARPQNQHGQQARPPHGQQPPQQPQPQPQQNNPVQAASASRHVDMRTVKVNLDKYNERYETIAPTNLAKKDTGVRKQKLNQKSAQRGKPFMSRKDKDAAKIKKLEMERQRRQKLDITLPEEITVGDLALRLKVQSSEVIKRLMGIGVMASVNEIIDYDTAAMIAMEIGAKVSPEVIVTIEERLFDEADSSGGELEPRSPVIVVMGHVDHGKTSLLDSIRNTSVTEGEAGGITQHIGAYQVDVSGRKLTFLDTPGHAAFTSMRARGANVTDIAILVVAADDGIMPQTIEAINHAKAAEVSIIVAINKMDKPDANPSRIKQELTEHGLLIEDWGGDVICCEVSAKTGQGIDHLLEMVQLAADVKELKANPDRMAKGTVIEARLDKGRGPIATVLVQNGTLRLGDVIIAGMALGRVRVMHDDRGERIEQAGPSTPVEITGLGEVPQAGDVFNAVEDEKLARELVEKRRFDAREEQFKTYSKVTLDNLFEQISEGEVKDLPIIVKADVQGSVEAVKQSLEKIGNDEVRVRVIHGGVGAVRESDVMLANASNAIIVGFNVRPDPVAKEVADRDGVDIRLYRIIYDAINEIEDAMKGMLAPKTREVELGRAEVRQVYKISSVGTIAGCHVLSGKITRSAKIRVVRDGIIIADDLLDSLKRFKDDVKEVASGYECGMGLTKFNDIKEGDIFEAYEIEEYRD